MMVKEVLRGNDMKSLLKICINCNYYTLKLICPKCGIDTKSPLPPRFSIEDRYGKYRRKLKKQIEGCE